MMFGFGKNKRGAAAEKDSAMAEEKIDVAAIVRDAVKEAVAQTAASFAETLKPLSGRLDKLEATPAPAAATAAKAEPSGADKPLTAKELDARLEAHSAKQRASAAKSAFIADKLKDVPEEFHSKLGDDPTKWHAEEQSARERYRAVLKASGATIKDVSGATTGAGVKPPGEAVDYSKLSPTAAIEAGLKAGNANPGAAAATVAGASGQ
jgi:hypothetical protein